MTGIVALYVFWQLSLILITVASYLSKTDILRHVVSVGSSLVPSLDDLLEQDTARLQQLPFGSLGDAECFFSLGV